MVFSLGTHVVSCTLVDCMQNARKRALATSSKHLHGIYLQLTDR